MWSFVSTWPFSKQAAETAAEILSRGGDAMDAAIAGINRVESDPEVESVGKGGFLNEKGELAMDAAVMDGNTMKTGAVCAVRGFENPVNIARAVMEHTRHNILVGAGAEEFARKMGIPESPMEELITDHAREVWKAAQVQGHDTIGAIALDETGKMVACTSTSGANMKICGRVGDSPIIGSGFYAQSGVGAAVATGLGEDIMRTCCCFRVVSLMEAGLTPQEAVEKAIADSTKIIQNTGYYCDNIAIVCMNAKGEVGASCNHVDFTYTHIREGIEPQVVEVQPVLDNGGRPREV